MNQQPDKFFRDKLHDYQKSVSPEAWNRISQNLEKKNRAGLWLKVAASVLLLAITGILLYPRLKNDNSAAITETVAPPPVEQPAVVTQPAPIADAIQPAQKENAPRKNPARAKHLRPDKNTPPSEESVTAPAEEALQLPELTSTDLRPVESLEEDNQRIASTEEKVGEPSKGITIVFSAEEVNKKYLIKKEDDATSGNKSSSTLQKLLDKAYDLKHNQDPLGGLRQKKDEILAMNFRNDRQRTQND